MAGRDELRKVAVDALYDARDSGKMMDAAAEAVMNAVLDASGISIARPLPDHDNHHNAAVCPYCTDNGKHVMVRRDDLQVVLDSISDNRSSGQCHFVWEKECAARLREAIS